MSLRSTVPTLILGLTSLAVHAQTTVSKPTTTKPVQAVKSAVIRTRSCQIVRSQKVPLGNVAMYYTITVVSFGRPSALKPESRNIELNFDAGTSDVTGAYTVLEDTELDGMVDALEQIVATLDQKYDPVVIKVADHDYTTTDELGIITATGFHVSYGMGKAFIVLEPKAGVTYQFSKDDATTLLQHLKTAKSVLGKM